MPITYIKCIDCGLLLNKSGSLAEILILDDNCPNCGGKIILIEDDF